jgi:hypothetical protein
VDKVSLPIRDLPREAQVVFKYPHPGRILIRRRRPEWIAVIPAPDEAVVRSGYGSRRIQVVGMHVIHRSALGARLQYRHRHIAQVHRFLDRLARCIVFAQQMPLFIVHIECGDASSCSSSGQFTVLLRLSALPPLCQPVFQCGPSRCHFLAQDLLVRGLPLNAIGARDPTPT